MIEKTSQANSDAYKYKTKGHIKVSKIEQSKHPFVSIWSKPQQIGTDK